MNVLGLGTAVPPHEMSQSDVLAMSTDIICRDERQRRLLRVLFRQSGVENRHSVIPYELAYDWIEDERGEETFRGLSTSRRMTLYSEFGSALARASSTQALEDAGTDPREVTHLVTVSCTGFEAPGIDVFLIRELGLRPTTQRVHVGFMGCHGAVNGLRAAQGIVASQPNATVLLCAVECCSLHYRFSWDDEGVIGNALFADGSAALVLRAGRSRAADPGTWRMQSTGSCVIPDTEEVMSWRIGDHGFEMQLTSRVAESIETHLRPWLETWLSEQGLGVGDVAHWAVHPGGPRILKSVEAAMGLDSTALRISRDVLARFGNMSSPTVLFVLDRMSPPSGPCLLLGFGPGLVAEAALMVPA